MSLAQTIRQNVQNLLQLTRTAKASSYRLFDVELKQRIQLSPSLCRLVFSGPQLSDMHTLAADQRIKLLLPNAESPAVQLPHEGNWHANWKAIDPQHRPAMRTYTIRALRREQHELDVDFVLHGDNGPASAWASNAQPGDALQIVGPDIHFQGQTGGYEWQPPEGIERVLLIGDETALPAIAGILESLSQHPSPPEAEAFIEIPHEDDQLKLQLPANATVHWLARDSRNLGHGEGMQLAARKLARLPESGQPQRLKAINTDKHILWETAQPASREFYAWVAGETGAVMAIRKFWVSELGLDRRALTFMGYWKQGRSLD